MRFKLPKGYRVPPHTLSKAGLFTVISGTFRIGMGEKVDPSKARAMPVGSFIALAPGTPHFVSVDEETVVQLNNIGPWVITYIDPKDDPRQKLEQHASAEAAASPARFLSTPGDQRENSILGFYRREDRRVVSRDAKSGGTPTVVRRDTGSFGCHTRDQVLPFPNMLSPSGFAWYSGQ
jgi:hypothetical protein